MLDAHPVHAELVRDLVPAIPRRLVTLGTEQCDVVRDRGRDIAVEGRDGLVDGILRHDPVCRELAAGHNNESGNAVRDDVLAAEL